MQRTSGNTPSTLPETRARLDGSRGLRRRHILSDLGLAREPPSQTKHAILKVAALEADNTLQEAALTVHHACIQTLAGTNAIKLIENHNGVAFVQQVQIVAQTVPMQP